MELEKEKNGAKNMSPFGKAANAATPCVKQPPAIDHASSYGNHVDMLGVGATWVDSTALLEMVHAKS
jgi:hypothetical protein